MKYLDLNEAIKKGYKIPINGVLRGEKVEILEKLMNNMVRIRMIDNELYEDDIFVVDGKCIMCDE